MTETAAPAEPDGAPRIASLDVLRGLAILGILFMNINGMGASMIASFDAIRHLGWTTADQIAWMTREVLANGTARAMLEMLFGAGMVILTERAAQTASKWRVLRGYAWRNIVLLALGLVHVFVLLWPGDILHTYGVAALIVVLFRRLGPKWLLGLGLTLAVMQLGGGGYSYLTVPAKRAQVADLEAKQARGGALTKDEAETLKTGLEARSERAKRKATVTTDVAAEDKARAAATANFATWAGEAWRFFGWLQGKGLELLFLWEAVATMLIGAALYKWGILQGDRSRRFYLMTLVLAYGFGLSARAIGGVELMRFNDSPKTMWATMEAARLATTLGHVALVHLLLASAMGARLLKPFEAAGRTALSVYIAQTMICVWVLYPPFMLGLYGQQGWMAMMLTALAINAALLWGANRWVGTYRIGPVEWVWRSIVEGRRLPFRKRLYGDVPDLAPQPA